MIDEAVGEFNRRVQSAVEVDVARLPIRDESEAIIELVLAYLSEEKGPQQGLALGLDVHRRVQDWPV